MHCGILNALRTAVEETVRLGFLNSYHSANRVQRYNPLCAVSRVYAACCTVPQLRRDCYNTLLTFPQQRRHL